MSEIIDKRKCTGCNACAEICPVSCISMIPNEEGFLFPHRDMTKCTHCDLCERICPVNQKSEYPIQLSAAFAAISLDVTLRTDSSSGGVFSELACVVLNDGGAVYGAAYGEEYEVTHICVESEDELYRLRGAKYAQSNICGLFKKIEKQLQNNRLVLFSGAPCQVAGLKAYLKKDYPNLITVDFVCHGVPSPTVWKQYVVYRAEEDNDGVLPTNINLRSKITGWSRYNYCNVYDYQNGKQYLAPNGQDLYMKLFVEDYINRICCADCLFKGYDRISDITLGDFWGIWDIKPEMDDDRGTSLVLTHSPTGRRFLQLIEHRVNLHEVSLEQASAQNPSLLVSSIAKNDRTKIMAMAVHGNFNKIMMTLKSCDKKHDNLIIKLTKRVFRCRR